LGLDGVQLFATEMKLARKLISQEAVTVCFDDVMLGTGEAAMRFPEFVQLVCRLAKACFDTPAFARLKSPADHCAALIKILESAHDTALVMHARGQVLDKYESFQRWESDKLGHRARRPVVSDNELQEFVQAMDETGILDSVIGAFQFYCATTNLSSNPQREFLSQQGFVRLCKESKMLDNKLSRPMAEVIFTDHVVAVHKKTEAEDIRKSRESLAHGVVRNNKPKHTHQMSFEHFLKALTSCANLKYGKGEGLVRKMDDPVMSLMQLVNECIISNCGDRIGTYLAASELYNTEEVQGVLSTYGEPLKALFVAYATIDARSCPRWDTANLDSSNGLGLSFFQLWELMKDFELACVREGLQPQITRNQASYVFLCANREGLMADDKLEVVNFQEFQEILCNLAVFFIPTEQQQDITPLVLCQALQAIFSRMDAAPGMMKITLHYGGTHTGKLRLVPDPARRPQGWQGDVLKEEAEKSRLSPPRRYLEGGVRALHDEAYPEDGSAPTYVMSSLTMHNGSPPWRGAPEDELTVEAYAHSPTNFSQSPASARNSDVYEEENALE